MKLMNDGERQLLIDLAEEFPIMSERLMAMLRNDNEARRMAVLDAERRQYEAWRRRQIRRVERRRQVTYWLGPILTVAGCCAVIRIGWLMLEEPVGPGRIFGLVFWSSLLLAGVSLTRARHRPMDTPPEFKELS